MTGRTRGSPLNFLNKRLMARMSAAAPGRKSGKDDEEKKEEDGEEEKGEEDIGGDG